MFIQVRATTKLNFLGAHPSLLGFGQYFCCHGLTGLISETFFSWGFSPSLGFLCVLGELHVCRLTLYFNDQTVCEAFKLLSHHICTDTILHFSTINHYFVFGHIWNFYFTSCLK